ncbi:UTP--glucose-1-phosphate uridylyltransferase [Desulfonauticus submarinus]|uniref:UTP--glucose-1-phosphate uridylyltransferase n=1 Tax=Desulfonauticus submarinus TaxID=206665 RepID=A0A1H0EIP4_9BACT|nr:UTP--glucose-1-phosphate uridylyltransferase GalU [Desulfonauticus submarinus]SDN82201.1 UTP--glucose-1-phosphate uridylyltransferase [Desulfonauticus submarinus]
MKIEKVVIPVAGWGTRSLPATKNIPKEMLPVYRKPAVQYVVEEAMMAGLTDVVFVTNKNKRALEDHFDRNLSLEMVLKRAGKQDLLDQVIKVAEMVNIISVRQKEQLGLGHAVLCAREVVKKEPFAVLVGDDLIFSPSPAIEQLIEVAKTEQMPVVGVMEVPLERVSNYGIIGGEEISPGLFRVKKLHEKPLPENAPSRLAVVGRYVLTPDIFEYLEQVKPDSQGEYQLTDALHFLAKENRLLAVKVSGKRFDIGDWVDYLTANIYFGLKDEELKSELLNSLKELLSC